MDNQLLTLKGKARPTLIWLVQIYTFISCHYKLEVLGGITERGAAQSTATHVQFQQWTVLHWECVTLQSQEKGKGQQWGQKSNQAKNGSNPSSATSVGHCPVDQQHTWIFSVVATNRWVVLLDWRNTSPVTGWPPSCRTWVLLCRSLVMSPLISTTLPSTKPTRKEESSTRSRDQKHSLLLLSWAEPSGDLFRTM